MASNVITTATSISFASTSRLNTVKYTPQVGNKVGLQGSKEEATEGNRSRRSNTGVYATSSQLIRLLTRLFLVTRTSAASLKTKHGPADGLVSGLPYPQPRFRFRQFIMMDTSPESGERGFTLSQRHVFDTIPSLSVGGLVQRRGPKNEDSAWVLR